MRNQAKRTHFITQRFISQSVAFIRKKLRWSLEGLCDFVRSFKLIYPLGWIFIHNMCNSVMLVCKLAENLNTI